MTHPHVATPSARSIAVLNEPAITRLLGGGGLAPLGLKPGDRQRLTASAEVADLDSQEQLDLIWPNQDPVALTTGDAQAELFTVVERAKREWESAIDALPDLVCLVDQAGLVLRANRIVEDWNLGRVATVRGLPLHHLLHSGCSDPACYFLPIDRQVIDQVIQGELLDREAYDPILQRHVHVHARPLLDRNQASTYTAVIIVHDITERRRVELERERLIADLDAYAHTVAHDLKNPVGLVIGYAELMTSDLSSLSLTEVREHLQTIARVGRKLNDIIDELLLFAEVQDVQVETRPIEMGSIVTEAIERLQALIAKQQASLSVRDTWPAVIGHRQWVEEVWVNYLSNALKYGGPTPHIELGVDVQPNGLLRFWVKDAGPGISPEQQAHLFSRSGRARARSAKGHGLGLSIVQRIVEKLGGQVGVESNEVSGGCLFYFTLPATGQWPFDAPEALEA